MAAQVLLDPGEDLDLGRAIRGAVVEAREVDDRHLGNRVAAQLAAVYG
jgi:hypothetical protein